MKRTPLKRSSKPMRTRAKQTSDERKALAARAEWAKQFTRCWACGATRGFLSLHTHEIIRKSETNDWLHLANYTRLCFHCHGECHGGWLTKEILLTLKLLMDPANYDPDWIRKHAIKRHWEPAPLPELCRWFINT